MRRRAAATLCCGLLSLSACASSPPSNGPATIVPLHVALDDFIAFSNPAMCQETESFGKFLSGLIAWDDELVARKGKITASPFIASVLGPIRFNHDLGGYVATVPATAKWKGFDLVAISTFAPEGGDPADFTLHLAAPLADIASRLKSDGFDVVAGGTKTLDDSHGAYSLSVTLVSDPGDPSVSLFGCGPS